MISDFFSALTDIAGNGTSYEVAIRFFAVLGFAATGEWIAERAGTLNISLEGMLLAGAFGAAAGFELGNSTLLGMFFGIGASLIIAFLQANFSYRLEINQFVVGITLNVLVLALAVFLNSSLHPISKTASKLEIPGLREIPLLGEALFAQAWPTYFLYFLIPVAWWIVHKTRFGLEIRAVGSNPEAARISGIDILKRQRQSIYICGLTAGLGGSYLIFGQVGRFDESIVGGQGFIAIAAVLFGLWTLKGTILGCLLFGFAISLRLTLPGLGYEINSELLSALPIIFVILAVSVLIKRYKTPPVFS